MSEVLLCPSLQPKIADTKASKDVIYLDKFFKMMERDLSKCCYGEVDCLFAMDNSAIDVLLITDDLLRVANHKKRQGYVKLMDDVRAKGGKVCIFSSMHQSGKKLQDVSGIAATLRFPLPPLPPPSDLSDATSPPSSDDESEHEDDWYFKDFNEGDRDSPPISRTTSANNLNFDDSGGYINGAAGQQTASPTGGYNARVGEDFGF